LDHVYEVQRRNLQKGFTEKVEFNLFKDSSSEVVFSYSVLVDSNQITGIIRTFLAGHNFCMVWFSKGLPEKMPYEEILVMKERLEKIKAR
jgi:hypothetical protein